MSSDEQTARTRLRLNYISLINKLCGRSSVFTTCEGNNLTCTFVSVDRDGEKIGVENLETPANGVLSEAIIRTQDIDKIIFPNLY